MFVWGSRVLVSSLCVFSLHECLCVRVVCFCFVVVFMFVCYFMLRSFLCALCCCCVVFGSCFACFCCCVRVFGLFRVSLDRFACSLLSWCVLCLLPVFLCGNVF